MALLAEANSTAILFLLVLPLENFLMIGGVPLPDPKHLLSKKEAQLLGETVEKVWCVLTTRPNVKKSCRRGNPHGGGGKHNVLTQDVGTYLLGCNERTWSSKQNWAGQGRASREGCVGMQLHACACACSMSQKKK